MKPCFPAEVGHGLVGMTRKKGNELVNTLLKKFEGNLENVPVGKKYEECWDIQSSLVTAKTVELLLDIPEVLPKSKSKGGFQNQKFF